MQQATHRHGAHAVDRACARGHLTRLAAATVLSLLPLRAAIPAHAEVRFTVTNLGTLGGASSEAFAIHASGQVAGRADLPSGVAPATRWSGGVAQDLGALGGQFSNADGIDDAGQVVGDPYLVDNLQFRAVLWRDGSRSGLGPFGTVSQGEARAVSDAGSVVGCHGAYGATWGPGGVGSRLLPGPGSGRSEAPAIHAAGPIAGDAQAPGNANRRVLIWEGATIQDLGTLGGLNGTACGLNAKGEMVGSAQTAAGAPHGFWRLSGGLIDLHTLLAAVRDATVTGATVTGARAITANGQIAGTARFDGQNRAGLLTPTGSAGRPMLLVQGGAVLQVAPLFTVNDSGTVAGDGSIVGNLLNRGTVLPTNLTVASSFSNQGLVAGSGVLDAALANTAAGRVRSGASESLQALGSVHSNAGTIEVTGGGQQRHAGLLTNQAGGRIQPDNATLRLDGGLVDAGQLEVGFGGALHVATVATALLFGAVTQRTGALFTGTGTKRGEGGLSIGASPGPGLDAGSVNFGVGNPYTAEIGGMTACTATCGTDAALRGSSFDKSAGTALGGLTP